MQVPRAKGQTHTEKYAKEFPIKNLHNHLFPPRNCDIREVMYVSMLPPLITLLPAANYRALGIDGCESGYTPPSFFFFKEGYEMREEDPK